jgi:predicted TIM-barrel fold metal-dependent hydrolase
LKVNFAHFGLERNLFRVFPKRKWEKILLKFITDYPNVYVDFSSLAFDHDYYSYLEDLIRSHRHGETLKERILFGSDFMINLIWIDSYNQYLSTFFNTPHISDEKERFCSINPERFLFEKAIA